MKEGDKIEMLDHLAGDTAPYGRWLRGTITGVAPDGCYRVTTDAGTQWTQTRSGIRLRHPLIELAECAE